MNYLNSDTAYTLYYKAINSEIYVDKTLIIEKLSAKIGTANQHICITRPRRFGKSINAYMIGAYYTKGLDSNSIFQNFAISKTSTYSAHLNAHNVCFIDMSRTPDACPFQEVPWSTLLPIIIIFLFIHI